LELESPSHPRGRRWRETRDARKKDAKPRRRKGLLCLCSAASPGEKASSDRRADCTTRARKQAYNMYHPIATIPEAPTVVEALGVYLWRRRFSKLRSLHGTWVLGQHTDG